MIPNVNGFVDDQYNKDSHFGKIKSDFYYARSEGECGDDMAFYITVENQVITNVKYFTEKGCGHTRVAGQNLASRVKGKSLAQALSVTPIDIIAEEKILTGGHEHCAILAVTTFYNAVANYLLDLD
jgi:nitrogen fixation NifU-like protein